MPKMKTNRAAAKRFKLTGSGKVSRHQTGARHHLLIKSRSRKRRLVRAVLVHPSDQGRVLRQLGQR